MQRAAFTYRHDRCTQVLKTPAGICLPFILEEQAEGYKPVIEKYIAIWDTGATNSVITKKVVDDLQLKPIAVVEMHHAGGKSMSDVYLVNISLPGGVMIQHVRVTLAELINDGVPEDQQTHVLIGMDIIKMGDFAVTNQSNKTTLSFCIPTMKEIDFVPEAKESNVMQGGNRQQRRALKASKKTSKIG